MKKTCIICKETWISASGINNKCPDCREPDKEEEGFKN